MVLGARVNVIDTGGSGPPLLFLHGLGGLWQNWLLNIPAFMDSHRVIAPDLPGFGGSEMPAGRISIQGFARVIDALCDAAGDRVAGRRRQLDGRVHRGRAGAGVPDAGAQARADLRRRDLGREHVAEPVHGHRAADGGRHGAGGRQAAAGRQPAAAAARGAAAGGPLPGEAVGAAGLRAGRRARGRRGSSAGWTRSWATRSATGCRRSRSRR